jgi:hypothetical protein
MSCPSRSSGGSRRLALLGGANRRVDSNARVRSGPCGFDQAVTSPRQGRRCNGAGRRLFAFETDTVIESHLTWRFRRLRPARSTGAGAPDGPEEAVRVSFSGASSHPFDAARSRPWPLVILIRWPCKRFSTWSHLQSSRVRLTPLQQCVWLTSTRNSKGTSPEIQGLILTTTGLKLQWGMAESEGAMSVRLPKPVRRAGIRVRECGCVYRSLDVSKVRGVSRAWQRILVCNSHRSGASAPPSCSRGVAG